MQLLEVLKNIYAQKKEKLDTSVALSWEHFLEKGLPTKDLEAFRYVGIKRLEEIFLKPSEKKEKELKNCSNEPYHICFINQELQTVPPFSEDVAIESLSQAMKTYAPLIRGRFSSFIKEEKDPFALLNHALFEEGLFIYIPPDTKVQKPIRISFLYEGKERVYSPKILAYVGKNSQVEIQFETQSSENACFSNRFLEVHQEENSSFSLINNLEKASDLYHFDSVRGYLKKYAKFSYLSFANPENLQRQDLKIDLLEEGAEATLKGLNFLDKKAESHVHVLVRHLSPNCTSNQHFKSVLLNACKTSFEGKIFVDPIAQKTRAYQLHNALILSENAHVYAKPNLEIFADDVKASHGATISQLKQEELFYLQARGISQEKGKRLLVKGFCQEILKDFFDQELAKDLLEKAIQGS